VLICVCGLKDDSYGRDHVYVGYTQTFYDVNGINCNVRQLRTHISFASAKCIIAIDRHLKSERERERGRKREREGGRDRKQYHAISIEKLNQYIDGSKKVRWNLKLHHFHLYHINLNSSQIYSSHIRFFWGQTACQNISQQYA